MTSETHTLLGRVAAPPEHESTSGVFYFWVDKNQGIERTQIVVTESMVGARKVKFVGLVLEVYRRSRQKDIGEEAARFDGRAAEKSMFDSEGVTYAEVAILRTEPITHTPPTEESEVFLATPDDAAKGYGLDKIKPDSRLAVGVLRNGGTMFAGPAVVDLDFLLGKNGGHLNVNGIAGLGTKSTLLLSMNWLLLEKARKQREQFPGKSDRLEVVPVIFNVKNFDLFHIDRWNASYRENEADHQADWKTLGVDDPAPFTNVKYFAPQRPKIDSPVPTGGKATGVTAYSWALKDVIRWGLFRYLFSEGDVNEAVFGTLVNDVEERLTDDKVNPPQLRKTGPQTFNELLDDFRENGESYSADSVKGTRGKFLRRLKYIVQEGDGVLRRDQPEGKPLVIPAAGVAGPIVVDLNGLSGTPSLQRFVVAAVFDQIMKTQQHKQSKGLKYLITLDELNRFAPRGSSDPITETIETVAAEGRSQGVILFGAQQQASLVSVRVIENAAVKAIGRSGSLELSADVWKFLGKSARDAATQLQPEEKLLYQPSFREPMLAKIPYPPFALSEGEIDDTKAIAGVEPPKQATGANDYNAF